MDEARTLSCAYSLRLPTRGHFPNLHAQEGRPGLDRLTRLGEESQEELPDMWDRTPHPRVHLDARRLCALVETNGIVPQDFAVAGMDVGGRESRQVGIKSRGQWVGSRRPVKVGGC